MDSSFFILSKRVGGFNVKAWKRLIVTDKWHFGSPPQAESSRLLAHIAVGFFPGGS
jgi:hypothetical protein